MSLPVPSALLVCYDEDCISDSVSDSFIYQNSAKQEWE